MMNKGMLSTHEKVFHLGSPDAGRSQKRRLTANKYIPVKKILGVVVCACELMALFSVVLHLVKAVYRFEVRNVKD
jgi:hypothetical protein